MDNFIKFLSENWWQGLGGIIAITSALHQFFYKEKNKKILSFRLDKIYKKQNETIINLTFSSKGEEAIEPVDFIEPFNVHFSNEVNIIQLSTVSVSPPYLKPKIVFENNYFSLKPILLNKDSKIEVEVKVDKFDGYIYEESYLKNVKIIAIKKVNLINKKITQIASIFLPIFILTIAIYLGYKFASHINFVKYNTQTEKITVYIPSVLTFSNKITSIPTTIFIALINFIIYSYLKLRGGEKLELRLFEFITFFVNIVSFFQGARISILSFYMNFAPTELESIRLFIFVSGMAVSYLSLVGIIKLYKPYFVKRVLEN